MKFSELNENAQSRAVEDYISGWTFTHKNEKMSLKQAEMCCIDTEDDVEYNINGELKNV